MPKPKLAVAARSLLEGLGVKDGRGLCLFNTPDLLVSVGNNGHSQEARLVGGLRVISAAPLRTAAQKRGDEAEAHTAHEIRKRGWVALRMGARAPFDILAVHPNSAPRVVEVRTQTNVASLNRSVVAALAQTEGLVPRLYLVCARPGQTGKSSRWYMWESKRRTLVEHSFEALFPRQG